MRIENRGVFQRWSGLVGGVVLLATAGTSMAQVEEIVVTTRKREESLQNVPISISTISAAELQVRGIANLNDVAKMSPSVLFTQGFAPQDRNVTIRGLNSRRGRQNVAVLLDGVDITSESLQTVGGGLLIDPTLFDIERVEIVKGPQSALYGRSAFNGAISYISKLPSEELEGSVGTDVGSDGVLRVNGRVSGPLADNLYGGVVGNVFNYDGFYENSLTGEDVGGGDGYAVGGTLRWTPASRLEIVGRVTHANEDSDAYPWAGLDPNTDLPFGGKDFLAATSPLTTTIAEGNVLAPSRLPTDTFSGETVTGTVINPRSPAVTPIDVAALGLVPAQPQFGALRPAQPGFMVAYTGDYRDGDDLRASMSPDPRTCSDPNEGSTCSDFPGNELEVTRATLDIKWDAGPVTLSSLTAYVDGTTSQQQDGNGLGSAWDLPLLTETRFSNDQETVSQEFRVQSNGDGRFRWTVGGLYWNEEIDQVSDGSTCLALLHTLAPSAFAPLLPCGPIMAGIDPFAADPTRGQGGIDHWGREVEHYSGYFLVDFDIIDTVTFSFEGRYVTEDLDVYGPADGCRVDANGDGTIDAADVATCPVSERLFADTVIDPYGLYGAFNNPTAPPGPPAAVPGCVQYDPDGAGPGPAITGSCIQPRPSGIVSASDDDDYFVPKASLTWRAADNQTYYVSVANGIKAAGISVLNGGIGAFDPTGSKFDEEEHWVYELGAKTSWLDRRLTLNGAVFFDDYDKKLVSIQVPVGNLITTRTVNGGAAEVWGVELEANWAPTDNLTLGAGYTWLDAEWTDFQQLTTSQNSVAVGGNCAPTVVVFDRDGDGVLGESAVAGEINRRCNVDYNGNSLENAPEHAFVGTARYQDNLVGNTDWFVEGDGRYLSERYPDFENSQRYPEYWRANLRAGIQNEQWLFLAYVDNVMDDDTILSGLGQVDTRYIASFGSYLPSASARVLLPDPRTYGLRVNYRFGKK